MKIKKNDKVLILIGKDRGKSGKVVKVLPENSRVIIEGFNLQKRVVKPKRQGEKGQIISIAMPIRVDNVKLLCPSCGKSARVGYRLTKKGSNKERYCKKCEKTV